MPETVRDVLGERLGLERRLVEDHLANRVVDDLLEARHVRALLAGAEVDEALQLGVEELLAPVLPNPDDLLHPGDPDSGQRDVHGGQLRLHVRRGDRDGARVGHGKP